MGVRPTLGRLRDVIGLKSAGQTQNTRGHMSGQDEEVRANRNSQLTNDRHKTRSQKHLFIRSSALIPLAL